MTQIDVLIAGLMFATQVGLLIVEVLGSGTFGFLLLFLGGAGILLSAGISNIAGMPYFMDLAGWFIGWALLLLALVIVLFGKKALSHGGGR